MRQNDKVIEQNQDELDRLMNIEDRNLRNQIIEMENMEIWIDRQKE